MTLWFICGLFALALGDLWMRRGSGADTAAEEPGLQPAASLSFLLRPLIPSYRFFSRIERRLELRARVVTATGALGPWLPVGAPPNRPGYFMVHNPHENLWLAEQALLPGVLEADGNLSSAFRLLSARCRLSQGSEERFQFAVFSPDEPDDAPLFVSPVLEPRT
ncbi:MAG: hypothetical protein RJA70_2091 [Pseudomonadota bacterium]|jgi:hypothetical protein